MFSWDHGLFYIVFLGQIFLTSWFVPRKFLERARYVISTYPPAQFPKLYPKGADNYERGLRIFWRINQAIVIFGFVLLLLIMFVIDHSSFADDGYISEAWPAFYGIVQFIPLMMLELSEFSNAKLMRLSNTATTRKAQLRPRRLFDYLSPVLFGSAIAVIGLVIFYDLYVHDFVWDWPKDASQRTVVLVITNLFIVGVGAWTLYGRKPNPHQAFGDRSRQISASLQSLCFSSMALGAFFASQAADEVYDLDYLDATLMSVYFLVIVALSVGYMLRSVRIEDIDFDVYRADGANGQPA